MDRKKRVLLILVGLLAMVWVVKLGWKEAPEEVARSVKVPRGRKVVSLPRQPEAPQPTLWVATTPESPPDKTKDLFRPLYARRQEAVAVARRPGDRIGGARPPAAEPGRAPLPPGIPAPPGSEAGPPLPPGVQARAGPPPPPPGVRTPPAVPGAPTPAARPADSLQELSGLNFVGLMRKGEKRTIFLSKGGEVYLVKEGDLFLEKYRVRETADESLLLISPGQEKIEITFPEGKPLKVTLKK